MSRLRSALASVLDPGTYGQAFRLLHYYHYAHVAPRRRVQTGVGVRLAPNVSFRNGERVSIGAYAHVGERCLLWGGNSSGRVVLGEHALLGPEVFLTASNYRTEPGRPVMDQPKLEADVRIGRDVWLGARVMVVAGVTVGDGCVVGAGSVVTRSLPPGAIAVGAPARVVGWRDGRPVTPGPRAPDQESAAVHGAGSG